MRLNETTYTFLFAGAVCLVCSLLVSTSAVTLRSRQEANKLLDRQEKVLAVSGLIEEGKHPQPQEVRDLFAKSIQAKLVELKTGDYVPEDKANPATFDQLKAQADPATSVAAPPNDAQVKRLPNNALVYHVVQDGKVTALILPVEGKGLWSTLYGYIALGADTNSIEGLIFYQHGETPGLGGEVDNPHWKALWKGRKAYDESWVPAIRVLKGTAGSPEDAPHEVDGLSGATLTSNGVTRLLRFWLGDNGFGPYLKKFREQGS